MANITVRGVATAGGNGTTTATSLTPGVPAGTVVGDMLFLAGCFSGGNTSTVATPTGWVPIYTPTASQQTNDNLCLFGRIADGTGTDSPALTISPTAETFTATCTALGGTNGVLPSSAGSTAQVKLGGAASTTVTWAGITPSTANDLLIYFSGLRPTTASTQVTIVAPTGGTGGALTTQADICSNVTGAAESENSVITQQLTAATAVSQQTTTVATSVSSVTIAVVVTPVSIAVVQSKSFNAATSGSFTSNVTAGNSVILWMTAYTNSGLTISTSNPTYNGSSVAGAVQLMHTQGGANATVYCTCWLLPNLAGGAANFAITVTNGTVDTNVGMSIAEFSGLGSSPALDPVALPNPALASTGSGTQSANPSSGATGHNTLRPELILGMAIEYGTAITAPGSPWSSPTGGQAASGNAVGWQIFASTATPFTYTATSGSAQQWAAGCAIVSTTSMSPYSDIINVSQYSGMF